MTTQAESTEAWIPEMGYGDRLRRIRLDLHMDQREFAESIDMNKGTYGHHELSYHKRRGAKLVANSIELHHNVPAWWVLGDPAPVTRQSLSRHTAPVVSIWTAPSRRPARHDFIPSQQAG